MAVGLKAVCFIALRLEDEPLSEMSVELEGTAKPLVASSLPAWCELYLCSEQCDHIVVCSNTLTFCIFWELYSSHVMSN